jgi:hypothetical protein
MSEVEKPREPLNFENWRSVNFFIVILHHLMPLVTFSAVVSAVMLRKMKDSGFMGLILVKIHMEG